VEAYIAFLTPIWRAYHAEGGDTFDFQNMFSSLSNIPRDLIPAFMQMKISENELRKAETAEAEARKAEAEARKAESEAEARKVEAESEARKAEAEARKAEAEAETRKSEMEVRKAEAETRKDDAKAPAKHTFRVVINQDALGLKTQVAEEMQRLGLKGKIARVIREGESGEYDTDLTFEGAKGNVEKMRTFVRRLGFVLSTFVDVSFVGFDNLKVERTPDTFHRSRSSGSKEVIYEKHPINHHLSSPQFPVVEAKNSAELFYCVTATHAYSAVGPMISKLLIFTHFWEGKTNHLSSLRNFVMQMKPATGSFFATNATFYSTKAYGG